MSKLDINIRTASPSDAKEILDIYAPYVLDTAITFEYNVPSEEDFKKRIKNTLIKYPYIVAETNEQIVGYAYASEFHERDAYSHDVEVSIYVRNDMKGHKIGTKLYAVLEDILKGQNVLNSYACIAYIEKDDGHLNKNSVKFHSAMGYDTVGKFCKCGWKFGKWYDMIWMEKFIGKHESSPKEFIPFSDIRASLKNTF